MIHCQSVEYVDAAVKHYTPSHHSSPDSKPTQNWLSVDPQGWEKIGKFVEITESGAVPVHAEQYPEKT